MAAIEAPLGMGGGRIADTELRELAGSLSSLGEDASDDAVARLLRRLTARAREIGEPSPVIRLFEEYSRGASAGIRPRILLEQASLHGYLNQLRARVAFLKDAVRAAQASDDENAECEALLQLSLPVDSHVALGERRNLAEEGLRLAFRLGNPRLIAYGATNTALVCRWLGEVPSDSLRSHLEIYSRTAHTPEDVLSCLSVWHNWATQALVGGDYKEVRRGLQQATRFAMGNAGAELPGVRLRLLWRTGHWDEALQLADSWMERSLQEPDRALVTAVRTAVSIQRVATPDGGDLAPFAKTFEPVEVSGSALVRSILTDLRAVRREPLPARGAARAVADYRQIGIRAGWEDVLLAVADADPGEYRKVRESLYGAVPAGGRGVAMTMLADVNAHYRDEGVDARDLEAIGEDLLSAEDMFVGARALEQAARVRVRQGFRVGDLRRRAAAVYRDIGADRALALLLRTTGWAHDLGDFQVPSSQFKRPSAGLTPRELEVADLARLGFTVAEIAERLSISPQTSATHLKNLKRKLGITRKSELVRLNEDL